MFLYSYFNCFDDRIMKKLNNLMIAIVVIQQIWRCKSTYTRLSSLWSFYLSQVYAERFIRLTKEREYFFWKTFLTSFHINDEDEGMKKKRGALDDCRELKIRYFRLFRKNLNLKLSQMDKNVAFFFQRLIIFGI